MTTFAVIRNSDDAVVGVQDRPNIPPTPPGGKISYLTITAQEYADVNQDGVFFAGTQTPQWQKQGSNIVKITDSRPVLTFSPNAVNASVGGANPIVQVDGTVNNQTIDLGVAKVQLNGAGHGTLSVDTAVPRALVVGDGANHRVAAPLSISITRPVGQI